LQKDHRHGAQYGTNGHDWLVGSNDIDDLFGYDGNDLLIGLGGADNLVGGAGNDWLLGGAGNDWLFGGEGDDYLEGGSGADLLAGGSGNDTASYRNSPTGVSVSLGAPYIGGWAKWGDAEGDTLDGIENLWGSKFNDVLYGNESSNGLNGFEGNDILRGFAGGDTIDGGDGNDELYGYQDNDILNGGSGNDWVEGGAGGDSLTGGIGADRFVWWYTTESNLVFGMDVVKDFNRAEGDLLDLSLIDADPFTTGQPSLQIHRHVGLFRDARRNQVRPSRQRHRHLDSGRRKHSNHPPSRGPHARRKLVRTMSGLLIASLGRRLPLRQEDHREHNDQQEATQASVNARVRSRGIIRRRLSRR
jgi:Ca2+-binding RTX toxin-like protein